MSSLRKRNVLFPKEEDEGRGAANPSASNTNEEAEKVVMSLPIADAVPIRPKNNNNKLFQFLQAYVTFTSSSSNQDKLLKTLQYTLWMLSRFYRTSMTATGREALIHLSGQISWARYINRLLGWPAAIEAAKSGSWGGSSNNNKALGKMMAWSMVLYYPLEYISYVKWQVPKWGMASRTKIPRLAEQASAWSCRFWCAYIVLDVVRSSLALTTTATEETITSSLALTTAQQQRRRTEGLQILRNALFFLPAVHWSLPNWDTHPWLPDDLVNGCMWLESIACMYQGIRNVQDS
jgi:hypothetical protein